jgi:hypothetical protein
VVCFLPAFSHDTRRPEDEDGEQCHETKIKGLSLLIGYRKKKKSVVIVAVTHCDSHTLFLFSLSQEEE